MTTQENSLPSWANYSIILPNGNTIVSQHPFSYDKETHQFKIRENPWKELKLKYPKLTPHEHTKLTYYPRFIATDLDGQTHQFPLRPQIYKHRWGLVGFPEDQEYPLATAEFNIATNEYSWRHSLIRLSRQPKSYNSAFKYKTTDRDGTQRLFTHRPIPVLDGQYWQKTQGRSVKLEKCMRYAVDWHTSLVLLQTKENLR